jgi:hypothetical protein
VEEGSLKRINHSSFGARYVAKGIGGIAGQMLAFCIAGHHGGVEPRICSTAFERVDVIDDVSGTAAVGQPIRHGCSRLKLFLAVVLRL